ncbi:MAG: HYR domain-containing protein [Haliscomenobacteraceae bacterium CHB4]|nr:HYR domain-containing protein [Haliscomenobacteraceae bacterium CHB4]
MRTLTQLQFYRKQKWLLFIAISCAAFVQHINAQVSAYTFSQLSGTYTPITGGIVLGNASSDDQRFVDPAVPLGGTVNTGPGFPIGFTFNYNGIDFDRVGINNNGWISLGQSALSPSVDMNTTSSYTPLSSTAANTPAYLRSRVAVLGADLQAQTGAELRIETIGGAPFRTFVVQWTNYKRYGTAGTGHNLTFQIRLNEAGGVATDQTVEIVWGTMVFNTTSSTAHVGMGGTASTDFNNRATVAPHDWNNTIAGTANTSSCTFVNTANPPTSGTTFSWTPPSCFAPSLNSISNISTTSADVNFSCNGCPGSYIVEYGVAPFNTPGAGGSPGAGGAIVTGGASPIALTGLNSATTYDVYIRQDCGGMYSANSPKISFTTACTPTGVPYTENFNGATTPNLPACTSREDLNGGSTWTTVTAPTGYTGITLRYTYNVSLPADDWFYTRGIDMTAGSTYRLTFKYGNNSTSYTEKMKVALGTSPSAGAMTTTLLDFPNITGNVVQNASVDFTAPSSGTYYLGFHAYSITNQFYLYVDDIQLLQSVSCLAAPSAPADGSSDCPPSGATTLSWPAEPAATSYDVYFGTSPNPPLVANVTGTSYDAGALTYGSYYWKIVPKNALGEATGCPEWSFTYADDEAPLISDCGSDQTLLADANCVAELGDYTGSVAFTDNCGSGTVEQSPVSGSIISGNTTVVFTVTDDAGNSSTCSITVTLSDETAPEFSNCADVEVGTSGGACSGVATFDLVATDNCDNDVAITQTGGPASGSVFDLGSTLVSFSAQDDAGNISNCEFNVIVSDDDAPEISVCPPNVAVTTDDNCQVATADYTSLVVANDNCDADLSVTQDPAPGSISAGFLTIVMTVTDAAGNASTCSFQTTADDMTPPTIECPDPQYFDADDDCQTPLPDFTGLANASDNCGGFLVTQSPVAGTLVGFGQTLVTLTVTDGPGLTATCVMEAYAVDVTPPVITCPPSVTLNTDPNTCTAVAMFMCPVAPDNCSGSANPEQILGLPSGSAFPLGVNVVGFQATDASGNSASCTFTITVVDNDPPYLSCPFDIVMDTDPGLCSAVVNWSTPTTHDNCDVPTLEQTGGLPNGSAFPKGTSVISYQSTDASGNSTTCSFSITVNDNEAPVITCPNNITVGNTPNQCGANVTYPAPTFSDNCPGASIMLISGLPSGAFFPVGTTTNVWQVTDASGNTATCSFTVTVNDVQPPTITCPANIVKNNDPDQCGAIVTYATPTFSDNCPGVTIEQIAGLPSGSFFPVGTTTNVFKATDAAGNMSTCSFTVTVLDVQPPVFNNCPANITVVNDPGVCGAVVTWPKITASDNCPGVVVTFVSGMASGSLFDVGTTTVIYKATDASGNMATCSFNVIVLDNENPSITCPNNIVKNNDINKCSATIAFIGTASATDNCGIASLTNDDVTGPVYPVGVTTITWTAVDAAGNDATCQQTITVKDYQPPLLICPEDIYTINDPNLFCQAAVEYEATATDNCPGVEIHYSEWPPSENGLFSVGNTTVMVTATDAAGNQTMCKFCIVVELAPEICNGLDDDCDGFVDETDDSWRQSDKQMADIGQTGDLYGASVAMNGSYAVVGAKNADGNGSNSGLAYVLQNNDNNPDDWQQVAVLNPGDVEAEDLFGASVSVYSNLIVVGAPQDDDQASNAGAAYIFAKNTSNNTWDLVKKIKANDGFADDNFGAAVSVYGDKVLVGASMNDEKGLNAGAAYLFGKNEGGTDNWGQIAKITAVDAGAGDMFGASLKLDGDLAVVGAALEDEKGMNAGAAYLFGKDQGGANAWGQLKKLLANDGAALDNFGTSVGISADIVIVGANQNDDKGSNSGSAYIFERNAGGTNNWGQAVKLLAEDGTANDQLGFAVAVNGNFAIAGARFDNHKGSNSGAAYIWERQQNGFWEYAAKLYDNQGDKNDQFGSALDIYKKNIVIGALRDDVAGKADQGSVSFFVAGCGDDFNGNPVDKILPGGGTKTGPFEVKAYPQPFSDVLNIDINVPAASNARVVVWNAYGQEVATVYNGVLDGPTTLRWNAGGVSAGTYFLRVEADNETEVKSILLVR